MTPTERGIAEAFASAEAVDPARQRAAAHDDTRSWVDPNGYRLADRLWRQKQSARDAIEATLRTGLANRTAARDVSKQLEQQLNPEVRPRRVDGKLDGADVRRRAGKGVYTRAPYGSSVSYPAMRLARTEITRAHGAATIRTAGALGLQLKWRLSGRHPATDICDEYARADSGLGAGVYEPSAVPGYPAHPMCICTLVETQAGSDAELAEGLRAAWDGIAGGPIRAGGSDDDSLLAGGPIAAGGGAGSSKADREWLREVRRRAAAIDPATVDEAAVRRVGEAVRGGIIEGTRAQRDAVARAEQDWNAERRKLGYDIWPTLSAQEQYHVERRLQGLEARLVTLRKELRQAERSETLRVLGAIRPMGKDGSFAIQPGSDPAAAQVVNAQRHRLPTDWLDKMDSHPFSVEAKTNRGEVNQNPRTGQTILDTGVSHRPSTALHELMHVMEAVDPQFRSLEEEFWRRRTAGFGRPVALGGTYQPSEMHIADDFVNPYMGKVYPNRRNWEVASMGIEGILGDGAEIIGVDDDHADFVLGLLATQ